MSAPPPTRLITQAGTHGRNGRTPHSTSTQVGRAGRGSADEAPDPERLGGPAHGTAARARDALRPLRCVLVSTTQNLAKFGWSLWSVLLSTRFSLLKGLQCSRSVFSLGLRKGRGRASKVSAPQRPKLNLSNAGRRRSIADVAGKEVLAPPRRSKLLAPAAF